VLKSMTGYGSWEQSDGGRRIRVELKSVNQRFLDIQVKAPRLLLQVEERVRKLIESALARGRVTVYIEWRDDGAGAAPLVNEAAARRLVDDLRTLKEKLSLAGDVDVGTVAQFSSIFEGESETPRADEVWGAVEPVLRRALEGLVSMRDDEGAKLGEEFTLRLEAIEGLVEEIERAAPEIAAAMKERLAQRIKSLLDATVPVDETRVAQELAIAGERADVTEEIVRLKAHIVHAGDALMADGPAGKKLNFLVQEMHREANTIGSKSADAGLSSTVVSLKEEVEKLREQAQNVE